MRSAPLALGLLGLLGLVACRPTEAAPPEPESSASPVTVVSAAPPAIRASASAVLSASVSPVLSASASGAPTAKPRDPDACPEEMARIGRTCVDRWEAHLATIQTDGSEVPWPHEKRLEEGTKYLARSASGIFPQAYISRVEAKAACENAGKRLCSRREWKRACRGSKGFRYPYGNRGKRGACNTGKPHLLEQHLGKNPKKWTYEAFNDPELDLLPGFLAMSGSYETCHSDEGVFDMVGNLHEWVSDTVGSDIEEILERDHEERKKQPYRVGNGMFLGGFFSTTKEHGAGCAYTTIAHEPSYHDYSTGFRCCMDAPRASEEAPKKKR